MTNQTRQILCAVSLAALGSAGRAHAVCADTAALTSQSDKDISNRIPCGVPGNGNCGDLRTCNTNAIRDAYVLMDDEWAGRGTANFCQSTTELEKIVNAGILALGGVAFNQNQLFGSSYHSSESDYLFLTSGHELDGDWHDHLRYQAVDSISSPIPGFIVASQYQPVFGPAEDLIQTACIVYDTGSPIDTKRVHQADAPTRAATLVHESWHAWENEHGQGINTPCGHTQCGSQPTSGSCQSGNECDVFTPHSTANPGNMVNLQHRPWQAATEFLCDIADTPADWVPLTSRELAAANADVFGTSNFVNGPMPACFAFGFGQHFNRCPKQSLQCDQAIHCGSSAFVCNPQSGCCEAIPNSCTISGQQTCDGTCPCDTSTNCCIPPAK